MCGKCHRLTTSLADAYKGNRSRLALACACLRQVPLWDSLIYKAAIAPVRKCQSDEGKASRNRVGQAGHHLSSVRKNNASNESCTVLKYDAAARGSVACPAEIRKPINIPPFLVYCRFHLCLCEGKDLTIGKEAGVSLQLQLNSRSDLRMKSLEQLACRTWV